MSQNPNAEYQIPANDYSSNFQESTLHEEINNIYSKIGNIATVNFQPLPEKAKNPVISRLYEIGTDIEKARNNKLGN